MSQGGKFNLIWLHAKNVLGCRATYYLQFFPNTSSGEYPVKSWKLEDAKIMGMSGSLADEIAKQTCHNTLYDITHKQ